MSFGAGICGRSSASFEIAANSVSSFDAIDGLIKDWPPATDRMAAATSSIEISLSR